MTEFKDGDRVYSRNPRRDHKDYNTVYVVKGKNGFEYALEAEGNPGKRHSERADNLVPVGYSSDPQW
jgi:hypothetical protein